MKQKVPALGIKVVLIGEAGVGKTSLYKRFETDTFEENYSSTIGAAFTKFIINSDTDPVDVGLWDTAGHERYRTVVPMYFQRADYVFLVYDITDRSTFTSISEWNKMIIERAPKNVQIILIGNKSDLGEKREISYEEGCKEAETYAARFVETSAKTNSGIDMLKKIVENDYNTSILEAKKQSRPQEKTYAVDVNPAENSKESPQCGC